MIWGYHYFRKHPCRKWLFHHFHPFINGCLLASLGNLQGTEPLNPADAAMRCAGRGGVPVVPERSRGKEVDPSGFYQVKLYPEGNGTTLPESNSLPKAPKKSMVGRWCSLVLGALSPIFRGKLAMLVLGMLVEQLETPVTRDTPHTPCHHMPPGKLTCPLKITGWKMYFLYWNNPLFRGHVRFRGCIVFFFFFSFSVWCHDCIHNSPERYSVVFFSLGGKKLRGKFSLAN